MLIPIFFATFGFLYILSAKRKKALTVAWIGASALILVITVGIYFFGSGVSQPERWIVYLQVFMVIPAAVGILTLASLVNRRKGLAVIFSAVLVLGFVSVTTQMRKLRANCRGTKSLGLRSSLQKWPLRRRSQIIRMDG